MHSFNYDAKNATVVSENVRPDGNGNTVERVKLDNGVIIIYTKTPNGFEKLDTNFVLVKQPNGYYYSDLNEPKRDFHDYF